MSTKNDMLNKTMNSTLFTTKKSSAKQQEVNYDDTLSIFSDFYLVKYNQNYILQLGLKHSFVPVDNVAEDLSDYCKAILPIKLILEQLGTIPDNSNYFIFGHNAGHEVIQNQDPATFILKCNMKAGNYLAINLTVAPAVELADALKRIGLSERSSQYTVFIENVNSNILTTKTTSSYRAG